MRRIIRFLKTWVGFRLLWWAMGLIPADAAEEPFTRSTLTEYRKYHRYVAMCSLDGIRALPIDDWRRMAVRYGLVSPAIDDLDALSACTTVVLS